MRNFKSCIITGSTGSGGSYLIEHILEKKENIKIYGFYRSSKRFFFRNLINHKNVKLIELNLLNYNKLKKNIDKIKPDLIYHLASDANVRGSFDNPIKNSKNNNNLITINLLEAARYQGSFEKKKPLLIICSSSEVYGNVPKKEMPITENQIINPINPYAATKAYQDIISQVYFKSFKMNIIITRMFSYTNAREEIFFKLILQCKLPRLRKKKEISFSWQLKK